MNSPGVTDLLEKAARSLAAAERLLADGFPDFAAGRAYYSMYYATEGYLLDAFDLRNLGDYGAVRAVDDADARQALGNARVFCAAISTHLASTET